MASPTNLIEALVESLRADARVATLVTGGVYEASMPDGSVMPYCTIARGESRNQGIVGAQQWLDFVTVQFEVRAGTGALAQQVGEQLRDIAMAPRPPLVWFGYLAGRESGRYLTGGESLDIDDALGVDGTDVWVFTFPITFITARG